MRNRILLVGVLGLAAVGLGVYFFFGQDEQPEQPAQTEVAAAKTCTTYDGVVKEQCIEDYIGLSREDAVARAKLYKLLPSVVRVDGIPQMILGVGGPHIYLEIEDGVVASAYFEDGMPRYDESETSGLARTECTDYTAEDVKRPEDTKKELGTWSNKAGLLHARLGRLLPKSDFGGVWIGKTSRRVQVALVENTPTTTSSKNIILNMMEELDMSDGADINLVPNSLAELKRTARKIMDLGKEMLPIDDAWQLRTGIRNSCNKVDLSIPSQDDLTDIHREFIGAVEEQYSGLVYYDEWYGRGVIDVAEILR